MKGERKRKSNLYKKGHIPVNKNIKLEPRVKNELKSTQYMRPTQEELKIAGKDPILSSGQSPEGSAAETLMILRPSVTAPLVVEQNNFGLKHGR